MAKRKIFGNKKDKVADILSMIDELDFDDYQKLVDTLNAEDDKADETVKEEGEVKDEKDIKDDAKEEVVEEKAIDEKEGEEALDELEEHEDGDRPKWDEVWARLDALEANYGDVVGKLDKVFEDDIEDDEDRSFGASPKPDYEDKGGNGDKAVMDYYNRRK